MALYMYAVFGVCTALVLLWHSLYYSHVHARLCHATVYVHRICTATHMASQVLPELGKSMHVRRDVVPSKSKSYVKLSMSMSLSKRTFVKLVSQFINLL